MSEPVSIDRVWDAADPVAEALHTLQMSGAFYSRATFTSPWGMELPEMPGHLMFHVLVSGECRVESGDLKSLHLREGDFALIPHGHGHILRGGSDHPVVSLWDTDREHLTEHYELLSHGGGGAETVMICGAVRLDHPAARHLVSLLPPAIHLEHSASTRNQWMHSTVQLICHEAESLRPGGEAVITRLADLLVVQAIRAWIESDEVNTSWIAALRDREIGNAIRHIHRNPEQAWTVESLAKAVHMSRSAFARRFSEIVGESPAAYLTRWRMQLATTWLSTGEVRVADLPSRLGYGSEAAFSRAFKREVGVSPGAWATRG